MSAAVDMRCLWRHDTPLRIGSVVMPVSWWAQEYAGIAIRVLLARLRDGWPPVDAVEAPLYAIRPSDALRYEHDRAAQRFVAAHPDGADLADVADFLGVSHQRVSQVEHTALAKMERMLDREAVLAWLESIA